ncbi:MAG: hypothetical protein IK016_02875 [Lachnospiraceae bacterium]|nr:hypothetical protein [Lachnospiraceae bacterium]
MKKRNGRIRLMAALTLGCILLSCGKEVAQTEPGESDADLSDENYVFADNAPLLYREEERFFIIHPDGSVLRVDDVLTDAAYAPGQTTIALLTEGDPRLGSAAKTQLYLADGKNVRRIAEDVKDFALSTDGKAVVWQDGANRVTVTTTEGEERLLFEEDADCDVQLLAAGTEGESGYYLRTAKGATEPALIFFEGETRTERMASAALTKDALLFNADLTQILYDAEDGLHLLEGKEDSVTGISMPFSGECLLMPQGVVGAKAVSPFRSGTGPVTGVLDLRGALLRDTADGSVYRVGDGALLTPAGTHAAVLSGNGRQLVYTEDKGLYRRDLSLRDAKSELLASFQAERFTVSEDGERILFSLGDGSVYLIEGSAAPREILPAGSLAKDLASPFAFDEATATLYYADRSDRVMALATGSDKGREVETGGRPGSISMQDGVLYLTLSKSGTHRLLCSTDGEEWRQLLSDGDSATIIETGFTDGPWGQRGAFVVEDGYLPFADDGSMFFTKDGRTVFVRMHADPLWFDVNYQLTSNIRYSLDRGVTACLVAGTVYLVREDTVERIVRAAHETYLSADGSTVAWRDTMTSHYDGGNLYVQRGMVRKHLSENFTDYAAISPNGDHVLFSEVYQKDAHGAEKEWILRLFSGEEESPELFSTGQTISPLAVTDDGSLMHFVTTERVDSEMVHTLNVIKDGVHREIGEVKRDPTDYLYFNAGRNEVVYFDAQKNQTCLLRNGEEIIVIADPYSVRPLRRFGASFDYDWCGMVSVYFESTDSFEGELFYPGGRLNGMKRLTDGEVQTVIPEAASCRVYPDDTVYYITGKNELYVQDLSDADAEPELLLRGYPIDTWAFSREDGTAFLVTEEGKLLLLDADGEVTELTPDGPVDRIMYGGDEVYAAEYTMAGDAMVFLQNGVLYSVDNQGEIRETGVEGKVYEMYGSRKLCVKTQTTEGKRLYVSTDGIHFTLVTDCLDDR